MARKVFDLQADGRLLGASAVPAALSAPLTLDVWSGEHLGWAPHTVTATELPQI